MLLLITKSRFRCSHPARIAIQHISLLSLGGKMSNIVTEFFADVLDPFRAFQHVAALKTQSSIMEDKYSVLPGIASSIRGHSRIVRTTVARGTAYADLEVMMICVILFASSACTASGLLLMERNGTWGRLDRCGSTPSLGWGWLP